MTAVLDLITDSIIEIGALAIGEPLPAAESARALRLLTQMVSQWNTEGLMVYNVITTVKTLTVGQGSYTCGAGGNINIARPAKVLAAYNRDANGIDTPIYVTDNFLEYADITKKNSQSPMASVLYDDGAVPLKTLTLYPVPSSTAYTLVLWTAGAIDSLTTLATVILLPPGYERALRLNLAIELSPAYGKPVSPELAALAVDAKAQIKRNNTTIDQLEMPAGIPTRGNSYSLQDFYSGR